MRTVKSIPVPDTTVFGMGFHGESIPIRAAGTISLRSLNSAAIRKLLPGVDKTDIEIELRYIFDESASVRGSNDVFGARHEIALIAAEHLARRSGNKWHIGISTFDMNSDRELPRTRLNAKGLRAAEESLLSVTPGGSSNLGPSLRAAESSATQGPRLLVLATDLELFDPDVDSVYRLLLNNSATRTLVLVLNNPVPAALVGADRLDAVQITSGDKPEMLAASIVAAAQEVVSFTHPRGKAAR